MPTPYERMFGQAPAPAVTPGLIPGVPADLQNLPQGQFVPFPQPLPVEQQSNFVRSAPSNIQAPPPAPFVPPPPGFTGQEVADRLAAEQAGFPQAPPTAIPGTAPATAQPGAAPAKGHGGPHAPGMVEQFDTRINANQAAQEQASQELQTAITEGAADVAHAKQGQATERLGNAVELADKQKEINQHNAKLDAIDAQNLQQARDYTIPDFWKGREGARVGSTIAVALAGIGSGLLGSTSNTALNAIQHNIDSYFSREKEKVDNMYKYAEQQGKINNQTRFQYAQELLNLKDQHSYVMQAAADRVDAVAIQSKGAVDAAAQKTIAMGLRVPAEKAKLDVRNVNSEIELRKAQAYRAIQEGKTAGQLAITTKELGPIHAEFDKAEARLRGTARSPGPLTVLEDVRGLGDTLRQAAQSGDKTAMATAAVATMEKIARLNTGAAPSHEQMKMLNGLKGSPAQTEEAINSFFGSPTAAHQTMKSLLSLVDQSDEHVLHRIDKEREALVNTHLGQNGMAKTPAQRAAALGRIEGLTGSVTSRGPTGEVPRYQNDPNAPRTLQGTHAPGPAATPGQPAEGSTSTSKGRPIIFRGGQWVAQ